MVNRAQTSVAPQHTTVLVRPADWGKLHLTWMNVLHRLTNEGICSHDINVFVHVVSWQGQTVNDVDECASTPCLHGSSTTNTFTQHVNWVRFLCTCCDDTCDFSIVSQDCRHIYLRLYARVCRHECAIDQMNVGHNHAAMALVSRMTSKFHLCHSTRLHTSIREIDTECAIPVYTIAKE